MNHSPACTALIKRFEGCSLKAYRDPVGVWTCGWGATGIGVTPHTVWTQAQADARLDADLKAFDGAVSSFVAGGAPTSQNEFDALVSLAFNIGTRNLQDSTLMALHRAGNHIAAVGQFGKWNRAKGTVLAGLTKRRAAEAQLYRGTAKHD